jgi:hypothetical protein
MNDWTQLHAILDRIYSHGKKLNSRISQKVQGFDNNTNEHVVRLEYRVRVASEGKAPPSKPSTDRSSRLKYLSQLNR